MLRRKVSSGSGLRGLRDLVALASGVLFGGRARGWRRKRIRAAVSVAGSHELEVVKRVTILTKSRQNIRNGISGYSSKAAAYVDFSEASRELA